MQFVTFTSDLGLTDHYVAAVKAQIFSQLPNVQLIDISHQIQPFNIAQAAYYISNCKDEFPAGTIHLIHVDSAPVIHIGKPDLNMYPMVMELHNQFFIGLDNGIFSLIRGFEEANKLVRLDFSSAGIDLRSPMKNIYIPAAKHILAGKKIEDLGELVDSVRKAFTMQPTVNKNLIKGAVIHIDKFGNVITNISEALFTEIGENNAFTILFKNPGYFIDQISASYSDVPMGEKLALFNENGFLEIAINKGTTGSGGGANSLLGLNVKDVVRIEFHPPGSKNSINDLFNH